MNPYSVDTTLPGTDLTVAVEFYYTEGSPGCNYMPNGDPGYEDEPAELEIVQVLVNNCDIMQALSEETLEAIETKLLEMDYNEEWN